VFGIVLGIAHLNSQLTIQIPFAYFHILNLTNKKKIGIKMPSKIGIKIIKISINSHSYVRKCIFIFIGFLFLQD